MSAGRRATSLLAALALALLTHVPTQGQAGADTRRPGIAFMTPALQALQRDDSRNPAQLWIEEGRALWSQRGKSASGSGSSGSSSSSSSSGSANANASARAINNAETKACADCHAAGSERGMAARYPAFDAANNRPINLAGRIDQCRVRHQQAAPQGAEGAEVLALTAYLAQASRGLAWQPPADQRLTAWSVRGESIWQQRLGQLNLACSHCHDQHAGARLGGAAIPQAHPTGYPTYRLEWQALGTLQRRLRGCLVGVRAEPFAPQADEWLALEVYLSRRAAGMLLEGPAVRP